MQHDRRPLAAILGDVMGIQPAGHGKIHLNRAALPQSVQAVAQHEFDLGAVKRAFARLQLPRQAAAVQRQFQRLFRLVPHLVAADPLIGPGGQRQLHLVEAEIGVDPEQQVHERRHLDLNLILGAEDVGVVLDEVADPHQPVQGAGRLVAVAGAELGHAQRQVAVAAQSLVVNLDVARTVHRLDRVVAVFRRSGEHVVAELFPVAGAFPQHAIHDLRSVDFLIAVLAQQLADVVLHLDVDAPAPVVPEHHARRFLLDVEQVERLADLAVVALLRLFQPVQIGFQRLLIQPGGAVDTLEHLVAGIAAPVGPGHFHQLERLELAGGRHVRPPAEINEVGLPVQRNVLVGRNVGDDLRLVVLAHLAEEGDRLIARHHRAGQRNVLGRQFFHPRLNPFQILGGEGPLEGEVVIKAVLDHRADGDLSGRIELLDGMGQQMGAGMADDVQSFRIALGDDRQIRILGEGMRSIHQSAIHLAGQGGLGQAGANRGGDFMHADGGVERALAAIGERDDRHDCNSLIR